MSSPVLHLVNGEFYSGAERVQDILASGLPSFGYEAHLACLKPETFRARCSTPQFLVHDVPMGSKWDLLGASRRVTELARKLNAKILHTHTPRTALIGAAVAWETGLPRVHHAHSPTSSDTEDQLRNVVNTVIERVSVSGTKKFVAVSNSIASWLARLGVPEDRIVVIPNGVPALERAPIQGAPIRREKVVGMVALFRPRKGLEVLLQAVAQVRRSGVDVRIRAVGGFESFSYEQEMKKLASELGLEGHVDWVGFSSDVPSELLAMDIFAMPSLYGEGMPMGILEAMAAGLPILATNVEGIPEVVRDGADGFLVDPADPLALGSRLLTLATDGDMRARLSQNAVRRHAERFSAHSMTEHVSKVYDEILAGKVR